MGKKPNLSDSSRIGRTVMLATGISLGLALSFFAVIGKGVSEVVKSLDSLKDGNDR